MLLILRSKLRNIERVNKRILQLAVPSIISNITVPLLGLVDVAIVGHIGDAAYIGAIAVGSMLFNVIYWLFGFLRMGTSGMTSQALGRRDLAEVMRLLVRSLGIGVGIGLLFFVLQKWLIGGGLWAMSPEADVVELARRYCYVCIWGAPAVLGLYGFTGWFIGMQNTRIPMMVSLTQNVVNIIASLLLVFVGKMTVEGVALGMCVSAQALGADGELTGVVANLACPAQCVQHRLFVSPDFWGEAKMLLRKHFGEHIFLLPQCSAAGDQCPVDLVRWVEPESDVNDPNLKRTNPHKRKADPSMFDLSGMRKAGKRIANEIIEVYNEGLDAPQTDPEFVHEVHMMQLPLRRTTFAEVAAARRRIHDYLAEKSGDVDFNDAAALQVDLGILRREELQEKMDILDTESHILRLGTVAFATNPFELFLDFGNQIKARSYAEQTFLIQLANGTEGYLPTEKAEKGGHYSAFLASGLVGHAGGEQLVRETLKNINRLFAE